MQIAMIGLGRMGANMVRRLVRHGHDCVVFDVDADAVGHLTDELPSVTGTGDLRELVEATAAPRHVWIMVPAPVVGHTVETLAPMLAPGDTVVDGGNSWFRHAVDRAAWFREQHGVHFVDVGTSGGVHGLGRGYCLMVGGDPHAVESLRPVFDSLAPGVEAAERTPGRAGAPTASEHGWLHCGPPGAGHFVKMVHNGIEYGMMAAYAEGLNLLAKANLGPDAGELARYYDYDFDLAEITEVWRRGSVVTSWLLDLTAEALLADPRLDGYSGVVNDSGEGRWTVQAAVDEAVPTPVLAAALFQRFSSRGRADVADKVLSAMRAGFGGHRET